MPSPHCMLTNTLDFSRRGAIRFLENTISREAGLLSGATEQSRPGGQARPLDALSSQGYLAHKKQTPPRTLKLDYV